MIQEVTCCNDCPFKKLYPGIDYGYAFCHHPNSPDPPFGMIANYEITPDFCPLKKEDIVIKLKK